MILSLRGTILPAMPTSFVTHRVFHAELLCRLRRPSIIAERTAAGKAQFPARLCVFLWPDDKVLALFLSFFRAEPLCMAKWSVLSLLIMYWGSSFEARTVYPLNDVGDVSFFLIVPRTRPASEFHET